MMEYLDALDERVLSNYDVMTVGEMPQLTVETAREYAGEDGPLDMAFHFQHTKLDYDDGERWAVGDWDLTELKDITRRWQEGLADDGWNAVYWENHDQPRVVSRYGDPENYREESATMLATYLFTLSGTPYVYQGQELGMTNAEWPTMDDLRDVDAVNHAKELVEAGPYDGYEDVRDVVGYRTRDNARTPMQWDGSDHAGFTDGEPWIQVNPNYEAVNVAASDHPASVTNYYRSLVELRSEHDALVYGEYEDLLPEDEAVYAYTMSLGDDRLLTVLNFTGEAVRRTVPATDDGRLLLSNYGTEKRGTETLAPYEARVYALD